MATARETLFTGVLGRVVINSGDGACDAKSLVLDWQGVATIGIIRRSLNYSPFEAESWESGEEFPKVRSKASGSHELDCKVVW